MKRMSGATSALASDALLAAAVRAQDEGVLVARIAPASRTLKIVFANASFCAMTGYKLNALLGRSPGFLHAEKSDVREIRRWCCGDRTSAPLSGEGYVCRNDGATIHAAWSYRLIPGEVGPAGHLVATYRDTTEKRRLQEGLVHAQRLDAVGRLAGGVAHDFNNLLSVINGYCQILAGQVMGQPQILKEVEEIHQAGLKAAILTRQLLAFGRRHPLKVRVINVNRFVTSNADVLSRLLGDSGRVEFELDPAVGQVRVDPTQLQQVLFNLTLNARDALRTGGRVVIRTGRRKIKSGLNRRITDPAPGSYVYLVVEDNGTGMSAATQRQLFEPFFTTKPEGKGSGLGLSLVHGIVQQSGGFITVHSVLSKGSTFEILLPETAQREDAPPGPPGIEPLPSTRGHEMVLLVEEDDVVRKMVTGILTADGYRVVAVKTVGEALREAKTLTRPAQLVIASLSGDGANLVRTLHEADPGLRVLSTNAREETGPTWLKRSRWIHLPKPYALSDLLKAARSLLDA